MKISKNIAIVLITIIVIAAFAAVGFGVYRLGYTHGLAASTGGLLRDRFFRDFGGRFPHDLRRSMMPYFGVRQPLPGFPLWGIIPGLLLFVGVVALVILAVNSLKRSNREVNAAEADSSAPDA